LNPDRSLPGRFITLEGGEGAGKSTLITALATRLTEAGVDVVCTREPGGTPLAERLREVLLKRGHETIDAVAETLLMFTARSVHLRNRIHPALASGAWVISDRFTDASYAYQGYGRGVSLPLLDTLCTAVHPDFAPDRTLLLDLPVAVGMARARQREAPPDRFEQEQHDFFERVRQGYLARAAADPGRFRIVDATRGAAAVADAAFAAIRDLVPAQVNAGQ
jgi:dTMP kinase